MLQPRPLMEGQEAAIHQYYPAQAPPIGPGRHRGVVHVRSVPPRKGNTAKAGAEAKEGSKQSTSQHSKPEQLSRRAVQPPVCAVQPGRVLSLRTSLGLSRVREVMAQHQELEQQRQQRVTIADSALPRPSDHRRGKLKHAKLQPLGVVGKDLLQPQEFLGVVPVTFLRLQSRQRARAYTAPGTRTKNTDHTHLQQTPPSLSTDTAKSRKRSSSAVLPRNIPDEALRQLLSISRHTALLPEQTEKESDITQREQKPISHFFTTQADFMKIEMKGLRKDSPTKRSGSARLQKGNDTNNLPQVNKLPSIPDPPAEREEAVATKLTITVTKSISQSGQNSENPPKSEPSITQPLARLGPGTTSSVGASSPSHLAIVSLGSGEKKPAVERIATPRTGSYASGKGRLSQGWSPPQPIQPLRGSPIPRANIKEGAKDTSRLSPTASMMIDVNVNEFLTDN